MKREYLEIIKTRTIFLKENELSSDLILAGDYDGNMFFKFKLVYIEEQSEGRTKFDVTDEHHATFTIDTKPNANTALVDPMEIGTYQGKALYVDFNIGPLDSLSGQHTVIITFLKSSK